MSTRYFTITSRTHTPPTVVAKATSYDHAALRGAQHLEGHRAVAVRVGTRGKDVLYQVYVPALDSPAQRPVLVHAGTPFLVHDVRWDEDISAYSYL